MIKGENVRLRPIEKDDLPRFVEWFSDPEVRQYLDMYLPFSLAHEERWFEDLQERVERQEVVMLTIVASDGIQIGNISLFNIKWKDRYAELGITIGEKAYWGQGYGSDAIRTMLRLAFEEMNLHRVFLRVHADNARGISCYEKVGFKHEGTLRDSVFREGEYLDVHLMGILASEFNHRA